jgi:hypothetical protein
LYRATTPEISAILVTTPLRDLELHNHHRVVMIATAPLVTAIQIFGMAPASGTAGLRPNLRTFAICLGDRTSRTVSALLNGSLLPSQLPRRGTKRGAEQSSRRWAPLEFVGYAALFLRTIEGVPTCPQYHKLDPYKSSLVRFIALPYVLSFVPVQRTGTYYLYSPCIVVSLLYSCTAVPVLR